MAVHLTRIYTRTGDEGTTALGDMSRVAKTDERVTAYADCDETNSVLGVALALGHLPEEIARVLRQVQNDLFDVGADLCTPVVADPKYPPLRVTQAQVDRLENWCDEFNADLPKLDSFILPGGSAGSALLQQARAVARRAERSTWVLIDRERAAGTEDSVNATTALFLNRLSDLLFILARAANTSREPKWVPGGPESSR